MTHEVLLVFDPGQASAGLALAGNFRMIQQLLPRLAVVQTDADGLARLRGMPGVTAVIEDRVPVNVLRQLTPAERTFAEAWIAGRQPKQRPGEGLPWDTEGFQPP